MNDINELVTVIKKLAIGYQPNNQINKILSEKIMIPIIGPTGVGKSTIMTRARNLDSDFGYVRGFTTRPPREDDIRDLYKFISHDLAGLRSIIDALKQGSLVQATIHPTNGYVYGSDIESYAAKYNLLDVLTTAIPELEKINYKQIVPIFMVCPRDDWLRRVNLRTKVISNKNQSERWREAQISLNWALKNFDSINWVSNPDSQQETTTQKMIILAKGKIYSYQNEVQQAQQMLEITKNQL